MRTFGKRNVRVLINRSTENPAERRQFLKSAGAAGLGLVGAGMLSAAAVEMIPVAMTNAKYPGFRSRTGLAARRANRASQRACSQQRRYRSGCGQYGTPILRQRRPLVPGSAGRLATRLR
jgi:hypothetical protein